jgi:hypothetical protein
LTGIPLSDLGSAQYLGFPGGLYPNGQNFRPFAYEKAGLSLAARVEPLDIAGKPSISGKIVMLSIGMSNTSSEFLQFIRLVEADRRKNPRLLMIDAAGSGTDATKIADPLEDYWIHADNKLQRCEMTTAQVQVVWLKTAFAYVARGFPEKARLLQQALRAIVQILRTRFPQLKLIYISSRIYGGYSETNLNPEPVAYESAFAVKWFIEERINNLRPDSSMPWVAWGPYLWADGMTPRSDGLVWERSDFEPDGVHPSTKGASKVATMLLEFFQNDTTAKPWFLSPDGEALANRQ